VRGSRIVSLTHSLTHSLTLSLTSGLPLLRCIHTAAFVANQCIHFLAGAVQLVLGLRFQFSPGQTLAQAAHDRAPALFMHGPPAALPLSCPYKLFSRPTSCPLWQPLASDPVRAALAPRHVHSHAEANKQRVDCAVGPAEGPGAGAWRASRQ
jgi:hypothetical protein